MITLANNRTEWTAITVWTHMRQAHPGLIEFQRWQVLHTAAFEGYAASTRYAYTCEGIRYLKETGVLVERKGRFLLLAGGE